MSKIKVTKENYREIAEKLFFNSIKSEGKGVKLIPNRIPYIELFIVDPYGGVTSTHISAIIPVFNEKENKTILWDQGVFFYEEILTLLLSHPKISDINYLEDKNIITAIFEIPEQFWEEEEEW